MEVFVNIQTKCSSQWGSPCNFCE